MAGEVCTGKDYYRKNFFPRNYLNMYLNFEPGESLNCGRAHTPILDKFHKAFAEDGIQGDTLIDIGSGASIHQLLSACESFKEIIVTDFLEQNREEMKRWLKKDPEAFDWAPVLKYVCQLEGDSEKWKEKEEKLRTTIRQVLPCDVTLANPLDPLVLPPADCVVSTYCLESACDDIPAYCAAVKNAGSLVKPGGHLIFAAVTEETYYMVGPHKFGCLFLTPEIVETAVKGAGFEVLWSQLLGLIFPLAICDAKDTFFIVARKPSEAQ